MRWVMGECINKKLMTTLLLHALKPRDEEANVPRVLARVEPLDTPGALMTIGTCRVPR